MEDIVRYGEVALKRITTKLGSQEELKMYAGRTEDWQNVIRLDNRLENLKDEQPRGYFVKATNTYENETFFPIREWSEPRIVEKENWRNIGTYESNNGILAYVDKKRDVWIAKKTHDSIKSLEELGYVSARDIPTTTLSVPHSNDMGRGIEKLLDSYVQR